MVESIRIYFDDESISNHTVTTKVKFSMMDVKHGFVMTNHLQSN